MSPEMRERCRLAVLEGKRLAAEHRASLTPEARDRSDAFRAKVPELMLRAFCGEDNGHGRQQMLVLSVDDLREWRKTHPCRHRWAEAEKELLAL